MAIFVPSTRLIFELFLKSDYINLSSKVKISLKGNKKRKKQKGKKQINISEVKLSKFGYLDACLYPSLYSRL